MADRRLADCEFFNSLRHGLEFTIVASIHHVG